MEAARGPRGLDEIIAAFEQDGFTCAMTPQAGGTIRCGECGQSPAAGEFAVAALRRTEGASDPGDMSAIAAITCPTCGTPGTLVVRFGPEAGEADEDVLAALDRPEGSAT
jgi:hypothetical protein